jgi:hypothetical protein
MSASPPPPPASAPELVEPRRPGPIDRLVRVIQIINRFRESRYAFYCVEQCSDDCDGTSDTHPQLNHDEASPGDYDECPVSAINEIADALGM